MQAECCILLRAEKKQHLIWPTPEFCFLVDLAFASTNLGPVAETRHCSTPNFSRHVTSNIGGETKPQVPVGRMLEIIQFCTRPNMNQTKQRLS